MEHTLDGKVIALLSTDSFEDSELTEPKQALEDAGAEVTIISEHLGVITGKNGTEVAVDMTVEDVEPSEFDGLLLPGGVGNPDVLRQNDFAVEFVREFVEGGKPVAAICHAPWLLIEADVVKGRTLTSWPSLKTDIINAGGNWVDEPVVVDNGLVTSRKPDDIPDFNAKAIEEFAEGTHHPEA